MGLGPNGRSAPHGELQANDLTIGEYATRVSWRPRWRGIWTEARSLEFAIGADLLRDREAREAVGRVLRILDGAAEIAAGSPNPGGVTMSLRNLGLNLSGLGTKMLAAYLRREPMPADWDEPLTTLETSLDAYNEWVEGAIAAQEEAHAEEDAARTTDEP